MFVLGTLMGNNTMINFEERDSFLNDQIYFSPRMSVSLQHHVCYFYKTLGTLNNSAPSHPISEIISRSNINITNIQRKKLEWTPPPEASILTKGDVFISGRVCFYFCKINWNWSFTCSVLIRSVYREGYHHNQSAINYNKGKYFQWKLLHCTFVLALYPGLPMYFNVREKNQEGLVDLVM